VAEHMNRTIITNARCMLSNAGMSRHFWAEAAFVACYLINRSPSIPLDKKTSIEVVWYTSSLFTIGSFWLHCLCTCW
jgi:hypothetical protein